MFRGRDTCRHCSYAWEEHILVLHEVKEHKATVWDSAIEDARTILKAEIAQQHKLLTQANVDYARSLTKFVNRI